MSNRRKQPNMFGADDVLAALRASQQHLMPELERLRKNPDDVLVKLDWSRTVDKEALFAHRHIVKELLLRNSTGIFKKIVMRKGVLMWDKEVGGVIAKAPHRLDTTAMSLVALCQMVTAVRKNVTTGARTPQWLQELASLLDAEPPVGRASSHDSLELLPIDDEQAGEKPHPKRKARRILRRVSSAMSSCSTTTTDDGAGLTVPSTVPSTSKPIVHQQPSTSKAIVHQQPASNKKPARAPIADAGNIVWYAASEGQAFRMVEGVKEPACKSVEDDKSGMMIFVWPDGTNWISEKPALLHEEVLLATSFQGPLLCMLVVRASSVDFQVW